MQFILLLCFDHKDLKIVILFISLFVGSFHGLLMVHQASLYKNLSDFFHYALKHRVPYLLLLSFHLLFFSFRVNRIGHTSYRNCESNCLIFSIIVYFYFHSLDSF